MDKALIGAVFVIIALLVLMMTWNAGRSSAIADCKRDGFFWQYGERAECKPSKLPPQ